MLLDCNFLGLTSQLPTYKHRAAVRLQHEVGAPDLQDLGGTAKRIQAFLASVAPTLDNLQRHIVYTAVMECLENVNSHAYAEFKVAGTLSKRSRLWEVVGLQDPDRQVASVAILDRGVGIVRTAQKKVGMFNMNVDALRSRGDLIQMAASGKRTESGKPKHGKGLRTLREFAETHEGVSLQIVSSGVSVLWSSGARVQVTPTPRLDGTLVCVYLDAPT
jgi:anti-sigma regulatory factor (Ser/Thr protein kinase)